ncbi:MAG TPA: LytTR family DNA-binding domain-containing protein [Casimicrobiaceae bacterium]|nr:LytTR family DNA-binding domain-containing protein [Casimicrobiaceae bacterium]
MTDSRKTTAIIADDEPRLAHYLQDRLAALWPELLVVGIAENGVEAKALLDAEQPDIAFLDIRMPGITGLDVAKSADRALHVVFVTAFDQYAVDAFERAAVDYLLKPVEDKRLAQTIDRLRERIAHAQEGDAWRSALGALSRLAPAAAANGAPERLAWIRASVGQQVRLIAVDDVCYFQANDKYTSVFTKEGEALIRTPLRELAEDLDPARFWQVHRGTIVNVAHVQATNRDLTGRLSLALKTRSETLAVSRAFAHRFRQM